METNFSQWVYDLISILSFVLIWLPFLLFIFLLFLNVIYCCIQDIHLEKDYLKHCSDEQYKIISDYKDNVSFIRVMRKKRRLAKLFNENVKKDK